MERLLLLAGNEVDAEEVRLALPEVLPSAHDALDNNVMRGATGSLSQRVMAFERATVLAELERHGRNITQAAKALGLERSHLYKKCQQLGIDLQNLPKGTLGLQALRPTAIGVFSACCSIDSQNGLLARVITALIEPQVQGPDNLGSHLM